jgi:ATP-dependent helicase/nuclease subunit B
MLNIYYARENIDKDRFMYEHIGGVLARIRSEFDRAADGTPPVSRTAADASLGSQEIKVFATSASGGAAPGDAGAMSGSQNFHGNNAFTVNPGAVPKRVLLVVPEQYTLQAERGAMEAMGLPGFMDFDVLSMTSLGRRVFADVGGAADTKNFIDQYGKIMLIARLLHKHAADPDEHLEAFRASGPSAALAAHISDMISELKNFNITPSDLEDIAAMLGKDDLLGLKLSDIALIYRGFERELSGKLRDTADYLKEFTAKIPESGYIATSEIWLSGYDYLSPAMNDAVIELARKALGVNIVLTADENDPFFSLTNGLADKLTDEARKVGIKTERSHIDINYTRKLPAEIAHIEQNLFAGKSKPFVTSQTANAPQAQDASRAATHYANAITLTSAANFYAEAETVASQICDIIRDDGYQYRDILVLCNDMQTRVPILKRVFGEYGLPVFVDQRRAVEHNPVIELLLALPELAARGRKYEDVFRVLKTGFAGIDRNAVERLENYALEYRIRGSLWDREFIYGGTDNAEEMQALNEARAQVSALFAPFEKSFNKSRSAREKTECLRAFITDNMEISNRVETMARELEAAGTLEYAAELTAIESVALGVLDQLGNALGDIEMTPREYANCLRAGLNSVRIGMLPTSADQIVIGTMQRTRSSHAKAVFVVGANDGVLPSASEDDGILNSDEKQRLELTGNFLGRNDETVYFEEQLAIYRNLSKPSKKLYISYSAFDIRNKELRPSHIFNRIHKLFRDNIRIQKDIIAAVEDPLALVQYPEEALIHLTDNIRNAHSSGKTKLDAPWPDVMRVLQKKPEYRARLFNIQTGLNFNYSSAKRERVSRKTLEMLMKPTVSPSAIERYSRCPFSWFIGNALRLSERRVRELDYRSIGDIYHELLMQYGERVNNNAKWDSVTREECGHIIRETYENLTRTYKEGLLGKSAAESEEADGYTDYRKERITRVAAEAAWAVTNQVRESNISQMLFESSFSRGADFAPIEIDAADSAETKKLSVSGRIDRVDITDGENAVITDYKSGSEKFSAADIRGGWQLQLIIYLLAVTGSGDYKPGGINYLGISEPHIEDAGNADKLAKAIAKEFKPDGLFATNADSESHNEKLDELNELMDSVRGTLKTLAIDMLAGKVSANPKTAKKITAGFSGSPRTACSYCAYRGICGKI